MHKNPEFVFGALLAGVFAVFYFGMSFPTGTAVFDLVLGSLVLLRCWLPWARLGLRMTSIGMAVAGSILLAFGILLLQDLDLALRAIPLLIALLFAALLLLLVDRHAHRDAWRRWQQALERASLLAVVLGTYLPKASGGR